MKYVKLIQQDVEIAEFIDFWSKAYDNPLSESDLQKRCIYFEHISRHPKKEQDIQALFEWKNNGKLSIRKQKSLDTKIIQKRDIVNNLSQNFNSSKFEAEFKNVSAIWKIFLLHIIQPESYPMLDQYVMRAYYFLTEGNTNKNIPVKEIEKVEFYYMHYLSFFNGLADQVKSKHSRKQVDEALWAFGKFLKSNYAKMIFT